MDGSRIVTPLRMWASLRRTRRLHSAAASCERSLMPSNRPSSSNATALTIRPSSRASRTRSVRYSSPVAADGVRAPIRRRSQLGVEGVEPGVDLVAGQLVGRRVPAPRRSARPSRTRRARPGRARPGRRRTRWPGRSPRRPGGAPRGPRRGRRRSRAGRRRTGRGSRSRRPATTASAARTASPVPRGSSWRAKVARSAKTSIDGRDRPARRRRSGGRPAAPSAVLAQASRT